MLASILRRLFPSWSSSTRRETAPSGLAYWEQRAQQYGPRAVLNIGHKAEDVEAVTQLQLAAIFPHLQRSLRDDDRIAIDFGCGPGRFTPHLAKLVKGKAIGIDPIQSLLDLAPRGADVEYLLSDGHRIPIPNASVDLAWICLVLGGLVESQFTEAAEEIDRVLRPGGLLFLIENTSQKENCDHWQFRSVAEYRKLIPFVPLDHLHDYEDLGERISIMAGRKV
jgi:SAM-dependent methyltransferase